MSHHVFMTEHATYDRVLVGKTVKREFTRQYGSLSQFNRDAATRVSRKTLERIVAAVESVDWDTIEYVEGALGLPRDALAHVGDHDPEGLREVGADPDLVRWVSNELSKNTGVPGTKEREAI